MREQNVDAGLLAGRTSSDIYCLHGAIEPGVKPLTGIYDQEQDDTFEAEPNWEEITKLYQQEEADAPKIYDHETEFVEPVQQIEKVSLRQRAKRIMGRAAEVLDEKTVATLTLPQTFGSKLAMASVRTGKFLGIKEKSTMRRKVVTGAVIGAIALAGGASSLSQDGHPSAAAHKNAESGLVSPSKAQRHKQIRRSVAVVALKGGENPWVVSERQLKANGNAHPTDAQTWHEDLRVLRLNHMSLQQARNLPAGTRLKLPKIR